MNRQILSVVQRKQFKKDYKRMESRGKDINKLDEVVFKLMNREILPEKYRDHALKGEWEGFRECHIEPDWLLIYRIVENELILVLTRTGTHTDLEF